MNKNRPYPSSINNIQWLQSLAYFQKIDPPWTEPNPLFGEVLRHPNKHSTHANETCKKPKKLLRHTHVSGRRLFSLRREPEGLGWCPHLLVSRNRCSTSKWVSGPFSHWTMAKLSSSFPTTVVYSDSLRSPISLLTRICSAQFSRYAKCFVFECDAVDFGCFGNERVESWKIDL